MSVYQMNDPEREVLDEGNCGRATDRGRKPAIVCVNAGFVFRHPDAISSKLRGYGQKRHTRPDRLGEPAHQGKAVSRGPIR